METRRFGKTGFDASVLTLGGCGLGLLHEKDPQNYQKLADRAIKDAFNRGINIVDIAPSYGEAELRFRACVKKYRNKIFLAEKTMERTKIGAEKELYQSLEKLGVDHFDSYQFHAVSSMNELHQILGEGGALEAFKEAQETGVIKHIGITCHSDMRIILEALDRFDGFSSVLLPIYVAAMAHLDPSNDFRGVLKKAEEMDIGVTAIKAITKRRWIDEPKFSTWYEPEIEQEWIDTLIRYTLSQEGVTTYSISCDISLWPNIFRAVERYSYMDEEEQNHLIQRAFQAGFKPLFPE